jgi:hypothetical protein
MLPHCFSSEAAPVDPRKPASHYRVRIHPFVTDSANFSGFTSIFTRLRHGNLQIEVTHSDSSSTHNDAQHGPNLLGTHLRNAGSTEWNGGEPNRPIFVKPSTA